jgi:hypothetical protein
MRSDLMTMLSSPETQQWIWQNEHTDELDVVLKQTTVNSVPPQALAQQLVGRKKAKDKLPKWYATPGIVYPPALHIEQSSSAATGLHKFSIMSEGELAIDLTGGFGVDSFYLSQRFRNVVYVEPNDELMEYVKHNHRLLGANNITYHCSSAEAWIEQWRGKADLIYVDPSRRNQAQKTFLFSDGLPNVTALQRTLQHKAITVLIKASPLLDIRQGFRELLMAKACYVLSVDNDCKELLFISEGSEETIKAVDLRDDGSARYSFEFNVVEEKNVDPVYAQPKAWIYEPGVAVLKAGAFKLIGSRYGLYKLAANTHLYCSDGHVDQFPGRIFRVIDEVKMNARLISRFPFAQANIITRNYPLSVEEIKRKTGLSEGGELFLICTRSEKGKHCLIAERHY